MIFLIKSISVFLFTIIELKTSESLSLDNINSTLFVFTHISNCKRSEIYNLDQFSCFPCTPVANLQPSSDKLSCECLSRSVTQAEYDNSLRHPICTEPCDGKRSKCPDKPKSSCKLKYINYTDEQVGGPSKTIRIYSHPPSHPNDCDCSSRYNYIYSNYCIWKVLLKNYLNYNSFWQRGNLYANLKFIVFFCQSLQNTTACNHLANLCVQSFFDSDKDSPCSIFLLGQASEMRVYSNIGEDLNGLRPFLFYQKGRETTQELRESISYSYSSSENKRPGLLGLFTTTYSLDGGLVRWGPLRPSHVNLCDQYSRQLPRNFEYFRNFQIDCELTMENVIDLASSHGNRHFFSVFLNQTRNDIQYMKTIPVLIENAYEPNFESNIGEWQLVKRFQIIGAQPAYHSVASQIPIYEDLHKLRLFKSIRILRKFELRCTVLDNDTIMLPLIVLNYHHINISLNSSLDATYQFEFIVKFTKDHHSTTIYSICLPIFLAIGLGFAVFRSYVLKCRRNLECCDIIVIFEFGLQFVSNVANSFLTTVILYVSYSVFVFAFHPHVTPILSGQHVQLLEILIYSSVGLKGFYFVVTFLRIAHIDIFFVDWERPKNSDLSLHLKNNLETSSQCSSIRAYTENSVSAWRVFFIANEWIKLSDKQRISAFAQGFVSLACYGIIKSINPSFYSDLTVTLFICIAIFSTVHIIQRIIRKLIVNQIHGSPLNKFMDICAMANVSIFTLLDPAYGFYIHGRSPHGFADTDMSSMILQLQRESQNMCGKRGLLSDSDFQTYVMLLPLNLRNQIEKLLPLKQKPESLSQVHFQKEVGTPGNYYEGAMERSSTAYNRVNRFFCAFIDHAIKDMDYIIKEKSFIESLLGCEFETFLTENKGTFYIDNDLSFGSLFLYGNQFQIFIMELILLITLILLTSNCVASLVIVCIWNKLFQKIFHIWVKSNVAKKTLIDNRFLM